LGDTFTLDEWTEEFRDPVNDVWVQFGRCGSGICYELVAPLSDKSPVSRALSLRINVVNHVAYLVEDLDRQAQRLAATAFHPTAPPRPAIAYGGSRIQFFVSASGMIFELIEAPNHTHIFFSTNPRSAEENPGVSAT
jgi:methylmalonyl-CoA/ethylmalonyl-CoA epimerase